MPYLYIKNYWELVYLNSGDVMYNNIKAEIEKYLKKYPLAIYIYKQLIQIGDVYAMGGLLREYRDHSEIIELRDADFTINIKNRKMWNELLEQVPHKNNQFGGYKFVCSGFIIDVWDVKTTWAFKKGKVKIENENYFDNLTKTVFLNLDAIVYDLTNEKWNDQAYQNALKKGEVGIVLKDNPFEELNILRAMILREKYDMKYSSELARILLNYFKNENFYEDMLKMQNERYGYVILNSEKMWQEVEKARIEI